MNRIASTKNGLPLLICTQLTILIIICVPLCSTGIIKREIETITTTEQNWEPVKIVNNTSANVTTTTTTQSTPTTIKVTSSTTPSSTTKFTSTPRISRRTSTTTERRSTTQATTEKYAELISTDNITVATATDLQPVTAASRDNLDDDAEVITEFDGGVTTEEHRFDLSRYTSDYNGYDKEQADHNETYQRLTNDDENDTDHEMVTYSVDYKHNLRDMVLTTPETTYFDQKHKAYEVDSENDKGLERYRDDSKAANTNANVIDRRFDSESVLNDIHGNSTEERNQSTYLNKSELESTKYDVSANEIRNSTTANNTNSGEKRAKFMQEGSNVNLTIPSANEVWALASMKNVEHTKNEQGKFYNLSTHDKEPNDSQDSHNGTLVTKQLADWTAITKNNDFTNNTYTANNHTGDLTRLRERLEEVIRNINRTHALRANRTNSLNNTSRGKTKYQPKPIITTDQDTASQENQIIAVRLTTLPPPIVVTRNHSRTTPAPPSTSPEIGYAQNNIYFPGVNDESTTSVTTDMATETVTQNNGIDMEMTTIPSLSVDDSQNELKTKFLIKNVTTTTAKPVATTEFETTTDRTLQFTTENEQKTSSANDDEVVTTTQAYETTTMLTTMESTDSRTTTEKDIPTTNRVHPETEPVTEIDESVDRTTNEQTTLTTGHWPMSTENEILDSQSSTLPQYVEIEKTTEMKKPTTETVVVHTSTEFLQPTTTEIVERKVNTEINSIPEAEADNRQELTTTIINLNRDEYKYSTIKNRLEDTTQSPHSVDAIPEVVEENTQPSSTTVDQVPDEFSMDQPDTNTVIAISISVVGIVVIGIVLAVLFVLRKRKKQLTYGQRCRPVGLDAFSLDNVSVYNSVRRKGALRMSKRSYGNAAFDDPGLKNNLLTGAALTAFSQKRNEIYEEFKELPAVTARVEEVPVGCEDKNRYANIVPLPETRVFLKRIDDDEKTEYINANFVKGPKDSSHYYIACQAPLESTIVDFWRMIWEQNSRVIIMATDLIENGIEQCSEYLPPSFVIDNHVTFGDFHISLKHREVKDKYAMSMVHLKNMNTNTWREITHFWYQWPDTGVPTEQSSVIELLLEARGYLKVTTSEQIDDNENSQSNNGNLAVGNGNVDKSKSLLRTQGPLTVHCSPGTGRTGTIIACDIALRALEQPTRSVDIPQIVYFVRSGRASAVRTREQYEFIYKVANAYAAKLTGPATEN